MMKSTGKKDGFSKKQPNKRKPSEKTFSLPFVQKRMEECLEKALTSQSFREVADKLAEAEKWMRELEKLEKKGEYHGKIRAKDYLSSLHNRKNKILMEGAERALEAGETKEMLLSRRRFLPEEVIAFITSL